MRPIQLGLVVGVAAIVIVAVGYFATNPQLGISTTGSGTSSSFSVSTITSTCTTSCSTSFSTTSTSCISTTQLQTTSTTDSLVLEMGHMPASFFVGGYQFTTVYNGTYYTTSSNGVQYANNGFFLKFNVSMGAQNQSVLFGWAPDGPMARLPGPPNSTAFNGAVRMVWVTTCTALFLEVNTQA